MERNFHSRRKTRIGDVQGVDLLVDGTDSIPDSNTSTRQFYVSDHTKCSPWQKTYLISTRRVSSGIDGASWFMSWRHIPKNKPRLCRVNKPMLSYDDTMRCASLSIQMIRLLTISPDSFLAEYAPLWFQVSKRTPDDYDLVTWKIYTKKVNVYLET